MRNGRAVGENFARNLDAEESGTSPSQSPTNWAAHKWTDAAARGLIIVVAAIFAWYTWARWGDLHIDCGREVYVPIEILKGRMLYRDLWYPYGPLVPYAQALLLWIFGVHLNSFYCAGLVLSLSTAYLLYSLARRLLPPM